MPWFVLGAGSNILVSDDGFPGLVIRISGVFKEISFYENTVQVGAAVLLPILSRCFLENQWGGFEFMCDIPGTIGGAVLINAGTRGGEIADHFISAMIRTPDDQVRSMSKEEMAFSYRRTSLSGTQAIILSARFALPYRAEKDSIHKKMEQIITNRRQKQPRNKRNCGSVFKSYPGQSPPGWYIEQAGLKGTRVGDAMVAFEHANWIVNLGNAKAEHVKSLIDRIQGEVFSRFNVKLEREVSYIPEDVL
jgi:UDP-N-acetylmuramate dehydrogenase